MGEELGLWICKNCELGYTWDAVKEGLALLVKTIDNGKEVVCMNTMECMERKHLKNIRENLEYEEEHGS